MCVDRARREKQLRRDFLVGEPLGDEPRDLELLGRELGDRAGVSLARGLSRGSQLRPCPLGPGDGAERLERLERGSKVGARLDALAVPSQVFAVEQVSPRPVERAAALRVQAKRLGEIGLAVLAFRQQRSAARGERKRPGRGAGTRKALEHEERLARDLLAACARRRLNEVGGRNEHEVGMAKTGWRLAEGLKSSGRVVGPALSEVEEREPPLGEGSRDGQTIRRSLLGDDCGVLAAQRVLSLDGREPGEDTEEDRLCIRKPASRASLRPSLASAVTSCRPAAIPSTASDSRTSASWSTDPDARASETPRARSATSRAMSPTAPAPTAAHASQRGSSSSSARASARRTRGASLADFPSIRLVTPTRRSARNSTSSSPSVVSEAARRPASATRT